MLADFDPAVFTIFRDPKPLPGQLSLPFEQTDLFQNRLSEGNSMAKKKATVTTAKPTRAKAVKKAPIETKAEQGTEDALLKHSLTGLKFASPPSDEELQVAIAQHWRTLGQGKGRWDKYHAKSYDPRYGMAFWIGALPDGEPRWSSSKGDLLPAVRKVLELSGPSNAHKDQPAAPKRAKPLPADVLAGVEVIEQREFPLSFFKRTKLNMRTSFDDDFIDSLAPNIEAICKLSPIVCREDGTIVAGETRHRAGERAKVKKLFGKCIKCTDEQAAIIRLQENVQRRDLNPMERASGMQALQLEHGLSVDDVARIVGMKKGDSVRNLVRLFELPTEWQESVRSGELTAAAARDLVPWKDEPEVLAHVRSRLNGIGNREQRSVALPKALQSAQWECSKPLKDYHVNVGSLYVREVNLKPTEEQRTLLRVRKINGSDSERAFNVDLWVEMVCAAEKARADKEAKRLEKQEVSDNAAKSKGKPTAAEKAKAAENAQKQKDIFAKRLYRFRVAWNQAMVMAALNECNLTTLIAVITFVSTRQTHHGHTNTIMSSDSHDRSKVLPALLRQSKSHEELDAMLRRTVIYDVAGDFDKWTNVFDPCDIEALAAHLDIDIKRDWAKSFDFDSGGPCSHLWDSFVAIWNKEQMIGLVDDWKVKPPAGMNLETAKRKDIAALLTPAKPCPKAILEAKAVRLC